MSNRSTWKGPFIQEKLLRKVNNNITKKKYSVIKTWSRGSTILPNFVGLTIAVYNGRKFIPILVREQMIGMKFGMFAPTRSFYGHNNNSKNRS